MSTPDFKTPLRRVGLSFASDEGETRLPPEALETLRARARQLGLPLHPDPQIAALLAGLRLRDDVPVLLYAAAASVLAAVYDAGEEAAHQQTVPGLPPARTGMGPEGEDDFPVPGT